MLVLCKHTVHCCCMLSQWAHLMCAGFLRASSGAERKIGNADWLYRAGTA